MFVGDTFGTGAQSALGLRLGTATKVKLGSEARLHIERFLVNSGGVLGLERGAMHYDHDPRGGPSRVTVRSQFGTLVAVARGARFFAGPSKGVFGVFVERGEVKVYGENTAILVMSGFGTGIAHAGAEPTEQVPWSIKRCKNALASVLVDSGSCPLS